MLAAAATARPRSGNVRSETGPPLGLPRWLTILTGRPASWTLPTVQPSAYVVDAPETRRVGVWSDVMVSAFSNPGFSSAEPSRTRSVGVERKAQRPPGRSTPAAGPPDAEPGPQDRSRRVGGRVVEALSFRDDGAVHAEWLEHLALHEASEWLSAGLLDHRAHQNPTVDRVARPGPRLEPERVTGEELDRLVEVRAVLGGHAVAVDVVAATAVDTRDVAHQLASGDRPWLLRIRWHIALNRHIEIEAPPIVQKGGRTEVIGFESAPRRKRVSGVTGVRSTAA